MEWKVNIEEKPNQRILVRFDALNEYLVFIGQYKPHNKEWVNFSERKQPLYVQDTTVSSINEDKMKVMLINVVIIQELILKTYEDLERRLEAYENIAEGFKFIKLIEIQKPED